MADASGLAGTINNLRMIPLEATFFRVIHAKYAATALSAVGSYHYGGRYNPAGTFDTDSY